MLGRGAARQAARAGTAFRGAAKAGAHASFRRTMASVHNFRTLTEMLQLTVNLNHDRPAFGTRRAGTEEYDWHTYADFGAAVANCRTVFRANGVERGDRVAVISNNRYEWAIGAYASYSLGAQYVPMYEAQLEKDWRHILEDSGAKLLLVSTEDIYGRASNLLEVIPTLDRILCFDAPETKRYAFQRHMARAAAAGEAVEPVYPSPDDVASIIYTSGTTGKPKGVELTHRNLCSDVQGIEAVFPEEFLRVDVRTMSFLPWAHVFGQSMELHALLSHGSSMAIVPEVSQVLDSFRVAKPTLVLTVPLLLKRIHDGVLNKAALAGFPTKQLTNWAISVAERRADLLMAAKPVPPLLALQHLVADRLVLTRIRDVLGGRLRNFMAGGAATPVATLRFLEGIGVPVIEGYGLTETSPVITVNSPERRNRRLGTVGMAIGGVDVRVVDPETLEAVPHGEEGEIVCRGPNVMKGYRNRPEETAAVLVNLPGTPADEEWRFFRTGDRGKLSADGFLTVTGRIKELFKLENGKYVSPGPLEERLCSSAFVSQALVGGANREHTFALIVPDVAHVQGWALSGAAGDLAKAAARAGDDAALLAAPEVVKQLEEEVEWALRLMKRFERPRRWALLREPFSVANHMLTPKLSMRRHNIVAAYADAIEGLYEGTHGQLVSDATFMASVEDEVA